MSLKNKEKSVPIFRFEEIEHTADVALRVHGKDLKELLKNAALGMADFISEEKFLSEDYTEELVEIRADDAEGLLVEWLSELAFLVEVKSFIFQRVEILTFSETYLKASAYGKIARELKVHIKAVTYHNLKIVETENGFEATVVFDI
jgi:SHS2 domain-containing protein